MQRLSMTLDNYRACIEGRKTQTRRVAKGRVWKDAVCATDPEVQEGEEPGTYRHLLALYALGPDGYSRQVGNVRPRYSAGEVVGLTLPHWRGYTSRETWIWDQVTRVHRCIDGTDTTRHLSPAEMGAPLETPGVTGWRHVPAFFMPAWACLHHVEIVGVRPERLQEVTEQDARAEGCTSVDEFIALWDSINARRGYPWKSNPWVWVYEFRLLER